ncbi:hypothetical protein EXIGLDRAFT_806933 [Exidia glandulosa HHB12029]|uniref:Reverse transcriptase zinc-binding domain-containing protein n=1 Tax=Exidia glandulosa HHB12029 TaxID=1314781 RepID=A0A165M1Q0_EXIGL|nr:hypothetical protein EXIGLDRAFT_806933 [Exidia glandulosa HHB12029]
MAILDAARRAPHDRPILIKTNATRTVTRLTNAKEKLERQGWVMAGEDADVYRATVAALRRRSARTRIQFVCAEDNDPDYPHAMEAAVRALDEGAERAPLMTAPAAFDAPGIPLSSITQKLATRVIRQSKAIRTEPRTKTVENLERARNEMAPILKFRLPDVKIWRAQMHKDFSLEVRQFLWRVTHDGLRCGPFLANWGGDWVEKSKCKACPHRPVESIEHILFDCMDSARALIWSMAEGLWSATRLPWPALSLGTVIGCGAARFTYLDGRGEEQEAVGKSRLFRIILSEAAYLIWRLRCKRVIDHEDEPDWKHPTAFVESEWNRIINDRLTSDRLLTNQRIYKKKATKKSLVIDTWQCLIDPASLPDDWLNFPGVLVGKRPAQAGAPHSLRQRRA